MRTTKSQGSTSAAVAAEDVLDPTRPVALAGGRNVLVRELTWRELRQLIKAITTQMDKILSIDAGTGAVALRMEQLADVVLGDVSEALVSAASDVPVTELGNLRARDYTALLEAAVALNIHPEMVAAGKALAARVMALRAA